MTQLPAFLKSHNPSYFLSPLPPRLAASFAWMTPQEASRIPVFACYTSIFPVLLRSFLGSPLICPNCAPCTGFSYHRDCYFLICLPTVAHLPHWCFLKSKQPVPFLCLHWLSPLFWALFKTALLSPDPVVFDTLICNICCLYLSPPMPFPLTYFLLRTCHYQKLFDYFFAYYFIPIRSSVLCGQNLPLPPNPE